MCDVDILITDFGRVAKVFVTKRSAGAYYYAQQGNNGIEWVRQVHESEVLPYFVCPKDMAKKIAVAIDKEVGCGMVPDSDH